MDFIKIVNAGNQIKETNFFDTEHARHGKYYFSVNAGCIRMMMPDVLIDQLAEMKTGKKVIISMGPWPQMDRDDGFEIMFEDYSDCPYAIHVCLESFDILPAMNTTRRWEFAIWTRSGCMYQAKCYCRIVDEIPCMKEWGK